LLVCGWTALALVPSVGLARTGADTGTTEAALERPARLYIPAFELCYWYTGGVTLTDPDQPQALSLRGHTLRLNGMFGHRFTVVWRTSTAGSTSPVGRRCASTSTGAPTPWSTPATACGSCA